MVREPKRPLPWVLAEWRRLHDHRCPGRLLIDANGINNSGEVVGATLSDYSYGYTGFFQGFYWAGVIVGDYMGSSGNYNGFEGIPAGSAAPEPSATIILSTALVALARRKRMNRPA